MSNRLCLWLRLFAVAWVGPLLLAATPAKLCAECPPEAGIMLVPGSNPTNLGGTIRLDWFTTAAPPGWVWRNMEVEIRNSQQTHVAGGSLTWIVDTVHYYFLFITGPNPNGTYTATAKGELYNATTGEICPHQRTITLTIENPNSMPHEPGETLRRNPCPEHAPTRSMTHPLSGNQKMSVPVTRWDYKGVSFQFLLNYNSLSMVDPQQPARPNFAGLSDKNSKWTHSFAQWIDLNQDETGRVCAVWHNGDEHIAFDKSDTGGFTSPDSYHVMTFGGGPVTHAASPCGPVSAPYGWFTIRDGAGTVYEFNKPDDGQTHLVWSVGSCAAIPHYLLTRIRDRWGRTLKLTWSTGPEPRVTAVMDGGDPTIGQAPRGITLGYQNGLLTSVQDVQGHTHTLGYDDVPDETIPTPVNRKKLKEVVIKGPGDPIPVTYRWQFKYRDAANPGQAYDGTYTGDLVIEKIDPANETTYYWYEKVGMAADHTRPREQDWCGRIKRIFWYDSSEGSQVVRQITRDRDPMGPTATLTYPGGVAVRYSYTGSNLTAVTELAETVAARTWNLRYDGKHNLLKLWSPLETDTNPLVENEYITTNDANPDIDLIRTWLIAVIGGQRDKVETTFNDLHLPTQIKAFRNALETPLNADQITDYVYDKGAPIVVGTSKGDLTQIIEREPTYGNQTTTLEYNESMADLPDGLWGLPKRLINEVGGVSIFDYNNVSGRRERTESPENKLVSVGHMDRARSVTATAYEAHGLPTQVTDPADQTVNISYTALEPGSSVLRITLTFPDGQSQWLRLDGRGRITGHMDERGVLTAWTYSPQDQVKKISRQGRWTQRDTNFSYSDRGDLQWIEPPGAGTLGRIEYDHRVYKTDGTLETYNGQYPNGVYDGRVTRIKYPEQPNPRHEWFHYDAAGDLEWMRKQDGTRITVTRDARHQVTRLTYLKPNGTEAFRFDTEYDEFGRVKKSTDGQGVTTTKRDALDRLVQIVLPSPQKGQDYSYQPDTVLNRWTTTMNVAGLSYYQFREDSKGRVAEVFNNYVGQTHSLEYYRDGKLWKRRYANGVVEERGYTSRDWIETILIKKQDGSTLNQYSYSYIDQYTGQYDGTGRIRRETDVFSNAHQFFFDEDHYELTAETHPDFGGGGPGGTLRYQYDTRGNRTRRVTPTGTEYYASDLAGRLLWVNRGTDAAPGRGQSEPYTILDYDQNGRMIRRDRRYPGGLHQDLDFIWDEDDRLREVKVHATGELVFRAGYNGDGIRVKKTDKRGDLGLQMHDYSYSPYGLLHENNPSTVYTPGFGHRSNGVNSFYHVDWLGNTRYVTDLSGNNWSSALGYDAFGNRSASAGTYHPTDLQYGGAWGYQTEWAKSDDPGLGLQYLEQRYYDPLVGKFISADPIGIAGGLNLFAYVENDPVNYVDPSGEGGGIFAALGLLGVMGWWFLAGEAPADLPDPCYQHKWIVEQGPFQLLPGPAGKFSSIKTVPQLLGLPKLNTRDVVVYAAKQGVGKGMKYADPVAQLRLRGLSLTSGGKKLRELGLEERVNKETGRHTFYDPKTKQRRAAWDPDDPNHWHKYPPQTNDPRARLNDAGRLVDKYDTAAHIPSK